MGAFSYQALDAKGRKKNGVLEADTERQVRQFFYDLWHPTRGRKTLP